MNNLANASNALNPLSNNRTIENSSSAAYDEQLLRNQDETPRFEAVSLIQTSNALLIAKINELKHSFIESRDAKILNTTKNQIKELLQQLFETKNQFIALLPDEPDRNNQQYIEQQIENLDQANKTLSNLAIAYERHKLITDSLSTMQNIAQSNNSDLKKYQHNKRFLETILKNTNKLLSGYIMNYFEELNNLDYQMLNKLEGLLTTFEDKVSNITNAKSPQEIEQAYQDTQNLFNTIIETNNAMHLKQETSQCDHDKLDCLINKFPKLNDKAKQLWNNYKTAQRILTGMEYVLESKDITSFLRSSYMKEKNALHLKLSPFTKELKAFFLEKEQILDNHMQLQYITNLQALSQDIKSLADKLLNIDLTELNQYDFEKQESWHALYHSVVQQFDQYKAIKDKWYETYNSLLNQNNLEQYNINIKEDISLLDQLNNQHSYIIELNRSSIFLSKAQERFNELNNQITILAPVYYSYMQSLDITYNLILERKDQLLQQNDLDEKDRYNLKQIDNLLEKAAKLISDKKTQYNDA